MTAEEKEKIRELRLKGMGYKAIATILGLSRDSVRGFCKRNSLDGDSCVVALNVDEKIKRNLLCACCEKPIKQKHQGRTRRFCSEECRRKWWNEHQSERKKSEAATYRYTCPYCGNDFSAYGNKKRKYCSHNCYIKDRFWREEDGI
ncbi:helix-turn-helix domain-containing protein [Clostridium sp. KNHs214]|uniref:helix-turn-helix domain-containing protein n=1 Tax=Clostridium sp. KNHs214 TaxID=1540257 RepID=UPI00054DA54F|nr:helix-turn-helix domain-containing protein [Clostridium sp. KNHs214]